jgi:hypothetical protein
MAQTYLSKTGMNAGVAMNPLTRQAPRKKAALSKIGAASGVAMRPLTQTAPAPRTMTSLASTPAPTIFGMDPQKFQAMTGLLANAIAPNSMGGRIGKLTSSLAMQDIEEEKKKTEAASLYKRERADLLEKRKYGAGESTRMFKLGSLDRKAGFERSAVQQGKMFKLGTERMDKAAGIKTAAEKVKYDRDLPEHKLDMDIKQAKLTNLGKVKEVKASEFDIYRKARIAAGETDGAKIVEDFKNLKKSTAGVSSKGTASKNKHRTDHITKQMKIYNSDEGAYAKPHEKRKYRKQVETQYDAYEGGWKDIYDRKTGKLTFITKDWDVLSDTGVKLGEIKLSERQ